MSNPIQTPISWSLKQVETVSFEIFIHMISYEDCCNKSSKLKKMLQHE